MDDRLAPVGRLDAGDHVCLCYSDDAERQAVATGFIIDGLALGQRVVCGVDADPPSTWLGWLHIAPDKLDAAVASGQLVMVAAEELYLGAGGFDPTDVVSRLETVADRAGREGFEGLRIIADMRCLAGQGVDIGRIIEYERRVQRFLDELPALAICLYDRTCFSPADLERIQRTHRDGQVRADDLLDDGVLRIWPTFSPRGVVMAGEIDQLVRRQVASVLDATISGSVGDIVVDLSRLEFCDVGGLRVIVQAAWRLADDDRRLVLRDVPALMLEILRLSGWIGFPGLVYESEADVR